MNWSDEDYKGMASAVASKIKDRSESSIIVDLKWYCEESVRKYNHNNYDGYTWILSIIDVLTCPEDDTLMYVPTKAHGQLQ